MLNEFGSNRDVPLMVRLTVLFGGMFQRIGWFFFGFGMIFVIVFIGNADIASIYLFRGEMENVSGVITSTGKTRFSEGGSENTDGTPIFRYEYEFQVGETAFAGISYALGERHGAGDKVPIEFRKGNPKVSRIQGMRRAPMGLTVLFVLIFPGIGLVMVVPAFCKGWKACGLLKNGRLTRGKLISKEPTRTRVNKKLVYKLTFAFTDENGMERQTVTKSHEPERLEDESEERVIYDPWSSGDAMLVDNLPGKPRLNESGRVEGCSFGSTLASLLPPVFAVVALLFAAWLNSRF